MTDKQQNANRRNARKSTGPRTVKGKAKSSANALTYGIFSRGLMIDGEDPAEYAQLLQGLVDDLKPVGALEMIHVERIAMSVWRLRRLMRAESAAVGFRRDVRDTRKMRDKFHEMKQCLLRLNFTCATRPCGSA